MKALEAPLLSIPGQDVQGVDDLLSIPDQQVYSVSKIHEVFLKEEVGLFEESGGAHKTSPSR